MENKQFAYDVTQYDSYPYKQTHPNHLYTLGKLFGLKPKPFPQARILELGCAAGGNLIPMAYGAPDSECLGIDLSIKQIEEGQKVVDTLNLHNIELRHQSILDFPKSEGRFDYIICHGIYAWVPKETQDKILQICKDHLAEHGIAFVSYNTLPGWNMVKSIRDLMRYHVQHLTDPQEKAKQARGILQFVLNGIKNQNNPYAQCLEAEINLLSKQADSYLLHDHLEDLNFPLYFHEFVSHAQEHDLCYLSDTDLALMFPANLPPALSQEISKITDVVRLGQYMDFVRNQRFRQTLICHQAVQINRNLRTEQVMDFKLKFEGTVEGDESALEVDNAPISFKGNFITVNLTEYLPKKALWLLAKHKKPIHYHDLVNLILKETNGQDRASVEKLLNDKINLMRLALGGLVQLSSDDFSYAEKPGILPKLSPIAQHQVQSSFLLTNLRHEVVRVNAVEKELLKLCNGSLHKDHLGHALGNSLIKEKVPLYKEDGTVIQDKNEIFRRSKYLVDDMLKSFAKNALLVDSEV